MPSTYRADDAPVIDPVDAMVIVFVDVVSIPLVRVSVPLIVGEPDKLKPKALFNSRLPKVAPEIVLLLPVMLILPVPECVAVPAMFPATVMILPPSANVPAVKLIFPFTATAVVLPATDNVCPLLSTVRLLKVLLTEVPLIACAPAALLKVTVPEPGIKVPPLLVQLPPLPVRLILVAVPASKVPAVSVSVPPIFKAAVLPLIDNV